MARAALSQSERRGLRGFGYFFLDESFLFDDRDGIYGDKNREFPSNAERFTLRMYFPGAPIETMAKPSCAGQFFFSLP